MKELTPKEEEVLRKLWSEGEMTPRQVHESFDEPRPHFNTVATYLRILEQKGWVVKSPIAGTHLFTYRAKMNEEEVGRNSLKGIVTRFFNGSVAGMISSLLNDKDLTDDELQELIDLVNHKKGE